MITDSTDGPRRQVTASSVWKTMQCLWLVAMKAGFLPTLARCHAVPGYSVHKGTIERTESVQYVCTPVSAHRLTQFLLASITPCCQMVAR